MNGQTGDELVSNLGSGRSSWLYRPLCRRPMSLFADHLVAPGSPQYRKKSNYNNKLIVVVALSDTARLF